MISDLLQVVMARRFSGFVVSLARPANQLGVDFRDARHLNAMSEHGIEASRKLQTSGGFDPLENEADVHSSRGRGLAQTKLLRSTQADISLLGRELDVGAEGFPFRRKGLVNGS